jgi:hypothetical protein
LLDSDIERPRHNGKQSPSLTCDPWNQNGFGDVRSPHHLFSQAPCFPSSPRWATLDAWSGNVYEFRSSAMLESSQIPLLARIACPESHRQDIERNRGATNRHPAGHFARHDRASSKKTCTTLVQ